MPTLLKISFIVPALNAEKNIDQLIDSILLKPLPCDFEIIIVDHSSTDRTSELALKRNCIVLKKTGGTIASVRNFGVTASSGNILIFLDSDVNLTYAWHEKITEIIELIASTPLTLAGSHCSPTDNANWIEKYWFGEYQEESNQNSIGSAHMIISKLFFEDLNGFNEELETGEDYDLCMRAKQAGGVLHVDNRLKVTHLGYPENIPTFIKREAWHGIGDSRSFSSIINSKVALCSILFLFLHILIIIGIVTANKIYIASLFITLALYLFACSSYKYRHSSLKVKIINSFFYYFYFLGRVLSLKSLFIRKI